MKLIIVDQFIELNCLFCGKRHLVIQPEVPDIQDKEACSRFMKEFIKFCFNIEAMAK